LDKHFTLQGLPRPAFLLGAALNTTTPNTMVWVGDWYAMTVTITEVSAGGSELASQQLAKADCRFRSKLLRSSETSSLSTPLDGHCDEIRLTFPRHFETLSLLRPTLSFNVPSHELCSDSVRACASIDGGM
jgi:hypothetical protein